MEIRGRNGWFNFFRRVVDVFPNARDPECQVWIKFYSKKVGQYAPVQFKGRLSETIELFEDILVKLKKAERIMKIAKEGK